MYDLQLPETGQQIIRVHEKTGKNERKAARSKNGQLFQLI
jgi:hypothetical protein